MARKPIQWLQKKTGEQRRRLAAGEPAKPILSSKVQRAAVRGLAGFFALALTFTLLSRAADGVTVPQVTAQTTQTGILTQRVNLSGVLEPQGDLTLTLPEGVDVIRVAASVGQRVQAGDVLLELDGASLASAIQTLEGELSILDLKLESAAQGNSGASANALIEAQKTLEEAQEDHRRLTDSRTLSETRIQSDQAEAQADFDQAVADLETAKTQAKADLIEKAQENLDTVLESARDALDAAQQAVESADDAESASNAQYDNAVMTLQRAQNRLNAAKQALTAAQESGDAEAIKAAQAEVDSAQSAVDSAQAAVDGAFYSSSNSSRARENQKRTKEKWEKKTQEAEQALADAKGQTDLSREPLVISAQSALDSARQALKTAQRATEDAGLETENQLLTAQRAVERAERAVQEARRTAAQASAENERTRMQAEIDRLGFESQRQTLSQRLEALRQAAQDGGKLTAPIDGAVQWMLEETGKTKEETKVAVLSRSDQGFLFTASLDRKQAEKLAVGDKGTLSYNQGGKSQITEAVISALGAPDEKDQVQVTATLPQGTYPAGASAELEISRSSQQYPTVLPLGAIRADADGEYVLVLKETQTVMGTELTAEKVPVEVLEQDSENAAVRSDSLQYDSRIIASADKPVAEGDRVRLTEKP